MVRAALARLASKVVLMLVVAVGVNLLTVTTTSGPRSMRIVEWELQDEEMIMSMNVGQLRELIRETLESVGLYSRSAEELLILTAAAESNMGEYIRQVRGPARGIFQMEPATFHDIMERWLPTRSKDLREKVAAFESTFVGMRSPDTMVYNLKYAILVARLFYLRFPEPLPSHDDVHGMAVYHKRYFNTELGKATVAGTIEKYKRYVTG